MHLNNQIKLFSVFTFFLINSFLHSQTIVKINKESNQQLNLIEKMQLNLCYDMDNYLVVSASSTNDLINNNINFKILTQDNKTEPLIIVASDNRKPLNKSAYIGEIVLDIDGFRVEKVSGRNIDLSPRNGIKFIELKANSNIYRNVTSVLSKDFASQFTQTERNNIINSVNADSIAWFIQGLEDFQTRFAMHPNRFIVSQWIANQFIRMGYTNVVLDSFYVANYNSWQKNVIAIQEGTDFPDKYVIVGGHHDSINQDGPIYETSMNFAPGADDNASGVAVALEIARVMKLHNYQPRSSIRFVTFAMEELGLYGAYHDANKVTQENLNISAMINSDMIANSPANNWAFVIRNYPGADFMTNLALQKGQEFDMQMYTSSQYINASDSWAYHSVGIPAIFFSEYEFSPYYHSSNDLLINCNTDYAAQFVKLIASVTMSVSDMPEKPENYTLVDMGDGQSLRANWDLVNVDGISYSLRIKNLSNNQITEHETTTNYYEFNGLTQGTEYEVTLFSVLDGFESAGQVRYATPLNIPRQVANFSSEPLLNQISFNWATNTEGDLQGYKIYRKSDTTNEFTEVASLPTNTHNWTDENTIDKIWYEYKINAFDSDNNNSPDSEIIRTRHISLNSGILLIDLTYNTTTSPLNPPKDLVDEFYFSLLANYDFDEIEYTNTSQIIIEDIGIYSTIIIHKNSFNNVSSNHIQEILKSYIDFGGNIIFSANDPLNFINCVTTGYPSNFGFGNFAREYFDINSVNSNSNTRFAKGMPNGWNNLPVLEADTTKTLPGFDYKLFKMEVFTGNNYQELYTYESNSSNVNESAFDGMTVALYTTKGDSKILITSIPLYFIKQHQAQQFIETVLNEFDEETADSDNSLPAHTNNLQLNNYPNPFNPETTIEFYLPNQEYAEVNIYNVKGQLIKIIDKKLFSAGQNQVHWNGTDINGKHLSSGIYLYKVKTESGLQNTKKMLLLK